MYNRLADECPLTHIVPMPAEIYIRTRLIHECAHVS